jgi:hypothetical protein
MGDQPNPNSRTIPVTIKVTPTEAREMRRYGGSPGKGIRRVITEHFARGHYLLRSNDE